MIATWIKEARTDAKMSQADLGIKLALELGTERGHTKANISHWETKKHSPSLQQLLAIAKITGKSLPQSIVSAMQPGVAAVLSVVNADMTTLERLNAEERALVEDYRRSTAEGRKFMRKAGENSEKERSALQGGRMH